MVKFSYLKAEFLHLLAYPDHPLKLLVSVHVLHLPLYHRLNLIYYIILGIGQVLLLGKQRPDCWKLGTILVVHLYSQFTSAAAVFKFQQIKAILFQLHMQ